MATESGKMVEAALPGISGIPFVCFLFSVLWLSGLRGGRSCGGRIVLGSRLGCSFQVLEFHLYVGR